MTAYDRVPQSDSVQAVREFLERIADELELGAEIIVEREDDRIIGTFECEDIGLLIGHRGQTIDAVQHLAFRFAAAAAGAAPAPRVEIDAAGYRDRRRQVLQRLGDAAAEEAVAGGRAVGLEAMRANERKIVHEYLKERGDVETYSEGSEPHRHLVVNALRS